MFNDVNYCNIGEIQKLCLTAQISSLIVTSARHDATASLAVTAQGYADGTSDDFPHLDAPHCCVSPNTIPRPHENPVLHA
jgi:hypothetical protein